MTRLVSFRAAVLLVAVGVLAACNPVSEFERVSLSAAGAQVTWNLAGALTATVYPDGKRVTNTYDNAGRLTRVNDWTNRNYSYAYDANSNVVSLTYPQNVDVVTYDNADRATGITYRRGSTVLASIALDTASTGRIDAATATGLPAGDEVFGYDALDQLVSANGDAYSYDLSQNPTLLDGDTRQVFDDKNQLCFQAPTSVTGGSCATPPTGATTFGYGSRGQRTSMTPPGGPTTSYAYDESDQLKQVAPAGSPATAYTYDGRGLRQSITTGSATSAFTWDHVASRILTRTEASNTTRWVYGLGEAPLAQHAPDGTVTFLHHDQIGSVRLVTASTGTTLATRSWDAYGATETSTGIAGTPFGFAGAYEDAETGFLYLRARYYDPSTAQFLTRDPLVAVSGSAYGYVYNSPTNGTDPSGLLPGLEPDRVQDWKQNTADFSGGVLEALTIGQWRRSDFLSSRVNSCSNAYQYGVMSGTAIDLAIGAKGGAAGLRGTADDALKGADNAAAMARPGTPSGGSLSGGALARAGRGAEDLVSARIGLPRNAGAGRVTVPGSGAGGYRVPDFNPFGSTGTIATRGTVVEVKDVARLSSSPQLRDLVGFAQSQGVPLEIFTNAALPVRGQLAQWIRSGQVIISPL